MKNNIPLISIILPVYNGEQFLAQSIESCLAQTYSNFELIIVNDCSTDNSLQIAMDYQSNDERIKIVNNEKNLKLPASLNKGHQLAVGEFLTWTSDDNLYHSDALEKMILCLQNEQLDLVYCDCNVIDEHGKVSGFLPAKSPNMLLFDNVIGACFLYNKDIYVEVGGFDESLFLVEDYDFWLQIAHYGFMRPLSETLYDYRLHEKSLTGDIELNSKMARQFLLNMNYMFEKLISSFSLKDKSRLYKTLSLQKSSLEQTREFFSSPYLFPDLEILATNMRSFNKQEVKNIMFNKLIVATLINAEFQNWKNLLFLHKNCFSLWKNISFKRFIALQLKCLF